MLDYLISNINYSFMDIVQTFILTFVICSPLFINLAVCDLDKIRKKEIARKHLNEFMERLEQSNKRGI